MSILAGLVGSENQAWMAIVKRMAMELRNNHCRYEFMHSSAYVTLVTSDLPSSQRVYWSEILYRTHLASAASLLRTQLWIEGADAAAESENPLAFAACLRGFTEASADTWHGLRGIVLFLAENREFLIEAVAGRVTKCATAPQIEEQLIHFLAARKISLGESTDVPESHRALHMQKYFESFGGIAGSVKSLYSELCELTHPAKASLDIFVNTLSDGTSELRQCSPIPFIRQLFHRHGEAMPTLFGIGINTPMMTLKILNEFPIEKLHTPYLGNFDFSTNPNGARIGKLLGKPF